MKIVNNHDNSEILDIIDYSSAVIQSMAGLLEVENLFLYSLIHLFIHSPTIFWVQTMIPALKQRDYRWACLPLEKRSPNSGGRVDHVNQSSWLTEGGMPGVLLKLRRGTWIKSGVSQGRCHCHHRLIPTVAVHRLSQSLYFFDELEMCLFD